MREKRIIEIENRELPVDSKKKSILEDYEFKKNSGFANVIFFISVILTACLWIALLLVRK